MSLEMNDNKKSGVGLKTFNANVDENNELEEEDGNQGHDSENEEEVEELDEDEEDEEDEEEDEEDEEDEDETDGGGEGKSLKKIKKDHADEEGDDDIDEEIEENEDGDNNNTDFDEVSDDEEDYKKLENYSVIENLENEHPEIRSINFEEVVALSRVQRDAAGNIIDPLHMSIPFLTKYEKARIIGARAEQIDRGASPFVEVNESIMNGRTIAIMEFDEKKIPFIIARPMPNKSVEYWRLTDLEYL